MLEKNYIQSLKDLINNGIKSTDRTGIGTLRLINAPIFNIKENIIPILKGKFISPYNSFTELIWILTGRNDLKWLKDNGVNYWDSWVH
jgi:thymidylate synthase